MCRDDGAAIEDAENGACPELRAGKPLNVNRGVGGDKRIDGKHRVGLQSRREVLCAGETGFFFD